MAQLVVEGTWEEIARQSERFAGQRVRVIVLNGEGHKTETVPAQGRPVYFGMFKGDREPSDEDFRSAEFHGDPDDGLDWS